MKNIVIAIKNIFLVLCVFALSIFIFSSILITKSTTKWGMPIYEDRTGEIFIYSLALTVVSVFLYNKFTKKSNKVL